MDNITLFLGAFAMGFVVLGIVCGIMCIFSAEMRQHVKNEWGGK